MQQFLTTETLIIELLLVASLVAIVVRRLHVPYTVALVVVGLLLTNFYPISVVDRMEWVYHVGYGERRG